MAQQSNVLAASSSAVVTRLVWCAAQVRDEYRIDYDQGRGGYGKVVQQELAFQGMQGMQQVGCRGSWLPA
jgi:hypothetical protein